MVREIRMRRRVKIFKSVHLPAAGEGVPPVEGCIEKIKAYAAAGAQIIVLDTSDPSRKMFGGTGKRSDWDAAAEIVAASPLPVLFAGGISPDNVCEAITKVRPHGIDLVSGIESEVGKKDLEKMALLFERVRQCAVENIG
jgi:phosphoribosylanthranilate isomerase